MTARPPHTMCAECGALLPAGHACVDYFHQLLALEAQVDGGPGGEPHFLAVATYNLQHPGGFVPAAVMGLRDTVADVLAGRATMADALRRTRRATDGSTQVRRRPETPISDAERTVLAAWPTRWMMTVRDVCDVTPEQYVSQVRVWAACVTSALADVPVAGGTAARRS